MKIIHTSDWHLGQNFYSYDRDDEHRHFFCQLARIMAEERPDALVVSGDVFHTSAPPISAQRLFVEGVMQVHDASPGTVIVITAGNHDSGSRLEAESELWRRLGIHVVGGCSRNEDGTFDPARFLVKVSGKGYVLAAPYFHPSNYPLASPDTPRDARQRAFFDSLLSCVPSDDLPLVMMAHLAVEGCDTRGHDDEPVGGMLKEKLADLGSGYDYLALGHIHMPQCIGDAACYCGTPLPVSFSEDYDHYVNIVEITRRGLKPRVQRVPLSLQRRVVTLPEGGAPLDEALKAFSAFPDSDPSYVRILVDQEAMLAADANERARLQAKGKSCRLCGVFAKPRQVLPTDGEDISIAEIADFNRLDPLEIARKSYRRIRNLDLSPELDSMMQLAVKLASSEDQ